MGDVFCHAHHPSPSTPHQVTPRDGDCLTGEGVLRVKGGDVDFNKLIIHEVGIYIVVEFLISFRQTSTGVCDNGVWKT